MCSCLMLDLDPYLILSDLIYQKKFLFSSVHSYNNNNFHSYDL